MSRYSPHLGLVAHFHAGPSCRSGVAGVYALEPIHRGGLDMVEFGISHLRHLIWNGYHQEARRELFDLQHLAHEAVYLNGERLRPAVSRFRARCEELRSYLE